MGFTHNRGRRLSGAALALISGLLIVTSCDSDKGNGNGSSGFGVVRGTVHLPFELTAAAQPVAGATVFLFGGNYDSTVTTDSTGGFLFVDVPNISLTLTAGRGLCIADASAMITALADDTVTQDLTLSSQAPADCIGLPWAGAAQLAVEPGMNRAILLYDQNAPEGPALVVVDLLTGAGSSHALSDLDNVFDLEVIGSGQIVFNFENASGFGLRFFDVVGMTTIGDDIIYNNQAAALHHPGKLALGVNGDVLFVTHAHRPSISSTPLGQIFAVSLATRAFIDADDDPANGEFAFDTALVAGAFGWPHGIAFDDATTEILVGNFDQTLVSAIDWTLWGTFDRAGGPVSGTGVVRTIDMNPGVAGFAVWLWDFAGGQGVAAWKAGRQIPMAAYQSGSSESSLTRIEENIIFDSDNLILTVVPDRQSWFTSIWPEDGNPGIGERHLGSLERRHRYESMFAFNLEFEVKPRAFAVSAATGKLYVTYRKEAILEVFDLCEGAECDSGAL